MAVIPTGSASLRGVGPRAPALQRFDLDVQELARAATAPGRVADTLDVYKARRRERGIDEQTFEDRQGLATKTAAGANRRADSIEGRKDIIAENELGREVDVQTLANLQLAGDLDKAPSEIAAGKVEAEGKLARVGDEQTALGDAAFETVADFPDQRAARQMRTEAEIAADQLEVQKLGADLEIERQNSGRRVALAGQQQINEELKASRETETLSGTPETVIIEDDATGRRTETGIRTPTGELRQRSSVQTATPQQLAAERAKAKADNEYKNAIGQAQLLKQKDPRNKVYLNENTGQLGETEGRTVTVIAPDGTVLFNKAIGLGGTETAAGAGRTEIEQGLIDAKLTAEAPPVVENGVEFNPTGTNLGGYRRGVVYTHPTLGRVVYTGGDPFSPSSFQPIQ